MSDTEDAESAGASLGTTGGVSCEDRSFEILPGSAPGAACGIDASTLGSLRAMLRGSRSQAVRAAEVRTSTSPRRWRRG
jgi:hypothetical protein